MKKYMSINIVDGNESLLHIKDNAFNIRYGMTSHFYQWAPVNTADLSHKKNTKKTQN